MRPALALLTVGAACGSPNASPPTPDAPSGLVDVDANTVAPDAMMTAPDAEAAALGAGWIEEPFGYSPLTVPRAVIAHPTEPRHLRISGGPLVTDDEFTYDLSSDWTGKALTPPQTRSVTLIGSEVAWTAAAARADAFVTLVRKDVGNPANVPATFLRSPASIAFGSNQLNVQLALANTHWHPTGVAAIPAEPEAWAPFDAGVVVVLRGTNDWNSYFFSTDEADLHHAAFLDATHFAGLFEDGVRLCELIEPGYDGITCGALASGLPTTMLAQGIWRVGDQLVVRGATANRPGEGLRLWRSPTGAAFTEMSPPGEYSISYTSVAFAPGSSDHACAFTVRGLQSTPYLACTDDGGATWDDVPVLHPSLRGVHLAIDAAGTLFAVATESPEGIGARLFARAR
jgi:hypothetical protein